MPDWTAQVFQNEYLPEGGTDIHAIVTVTSKGTGQAGTSGAGAAEAIIIDCSGSMSAPRSKIVAARQAAAAAIDEIADGTWFAVIAGVGLAEPVYPQTGMVQADERTRAVASAAVAQLTPRGGTAIGQWLLTAFEHFRAAPAEQRHAILLTDGKNEGESAAQLQHAIDTVKGQFQCDCRGVGADWDVPELRGIAEAMLGSVELIADPADMAADFQAMMQNAMSRGVADAKLKVWAPQGAELMFVRQVAPTVQDLTDRRVDVTPLVTEYPTGAWGDESRDYHVCVRVPSAQIGQEMLAARVSLVLPQPDGTAQVLGQGLVRAVWTDDMAMSTRINAQVAHYTGQAELAQVIQQGLEARKAGDMDGATAKLGRAVQLASASGNEDTAKLLAKVVDVVDAASGTVRLKARVAEADEMTLDTRSTKTVRVKK